MRSSACVSHRVSASASRLVCSTVDDRPLGDRDARTQPRLEAVVGVGRRPVPVGGSDGRVRDGGVQAGGDRHERRDLLLEGAPQGVAGGLALPVRARSRVASFRCLRIASRHRRDAAGPRSVRTASGNRPVEEGKAETRAAGETMGV